ncbi:hypothetical protein R1sor_002367 [Riccia sorocarpa]|uniref:Uncharacterized protein n=1 Tax=Riccia sorocarpa TaxID=122646 RepID=A0ABD3GYL5_9MARC
MKAMGKSHEPMCLGPYMVICLHQLKRLVLKLERLDLKILTPKKTRGMKHQQKVLELKIAELEKADQMETWYIKKFASAKERNLELMSKLEAFNAIMREKSLESTNGENQPRSMFGWTFKMEVAELHEFLGVENLIERAGSTPYYSPPTSF